MHGNTVYIQPGFCHINPALPVTSPGHVQCPRRVPVVGPGYCMKTIVQPVSVFRARITVRAGLLLVRARILQMQRVRSTNGDLQKYRDEQAMKRIRSGVESPAAILRKRR